MECLQKRALKWITGYRNASYFENMVSLRLLPLPMFLQLNDLLLLSKLYHDKENALPLIETYEHQYVRVKSRLFKIPKLRTEKFRENFYFRTAKVANNLPEERLFPAFGTQKTYSFIHVGPSDAELQRKSSVYMDHFL